MAQRGAAGAERKRRSAAPWQESDESECVENRNGMEWVSEN